MTTNKRILLWGTIGAMVGLIMLGRGQNNRPASDSGATSPAEYQRK